MPIMLNTILMDAGLPLRDIRLVRHKDRSAKKGFSPYELWRDDLPAFVSYQSSQSIQNRPKFNAPYWAVFVVNFREESLFAGIYAAKYRGLIEKDTPKPHMDGIDEAGSCDIYELELTNFLQDLIGRVIIDWGPGAISWVQHAERNNKPIIELRKAFSEPNFPGFLNFIQPLSKLISIPSSWSAALRSSRGIYLLTCPKTKEQYVGSATGTEGFWGRWQYYITTGHADNVGLKSRDPSDYQVSILEVAGSSATKDDILTMEGRWQSKLQSKEMGLNRNLAARLKQ